MQEVVKMMYVLVETDDTSSLSSPLKTSNRIKFLSFAASENFIIFGATSGGLYVYNRQTFTFKSLVPNKEGPVTCVTISPNEKWFGFSTARGTSCVLEHNGSSVNRRILSSVHEGREVTALQWNNSSSQLYVGDNSGQISVISVASYLTPAVALMQLDSSVVQLDTCSYLLLASTTTRSYLCDTLREQYRQIGTRQRDGEFGACFYQVDSHETSIDILDNNADLKDSYNPFSSLNDGEWLLTDKHFQNVKLFCARPGLRLWEVRVDGAVVSTHQFKQLRSTSPASVIKPPGLGVPQETSEAPQPKHLAQFMKLNIVADNFIVTYDSNGLCVLDPMTSDVILWTDQFRNIIDMCVVGEILYLWMGDSRLHAISVIPIDKFLVRSYLQRKYLYCAQLCAAHSDILKKLAGVSLKMHVLVDLFDKIKDEEGEDSLDQEISEKLQDLLSEVSKNTQNQEQAQMLKSGIFIVGNAHLLSRKEEIRTKNPRVHTSDKLDANDLSVDFYPTLQGKQHCSSQDSGESETLNGIFKKSILPSISSLPLQSEHSNVNSDEDYDPFPDLPLSSLTSAETIMALKNLTTTVSGTISNGTKSLKEKWQNLEEKLRGQDESCLSVEKSINRLDLASSHVEESNDDEDQDIFAVSKEKSSMLPVLPLIEKCQQIASLKVDNGNDLQELEHEMLDCFASLYGKFRQSSRDDQGKDLSDSTEPTHSFGKWLNTYEAVSFPFHDHFEKEFLVVLRQQFQLSLKSGSLLKWVAQYVPCIEFNEELFPAHIRLIHSDETLLVDQALGFTLEICKLLLDPHTAFQFLSESGSVCHYFSWNIIMNFFQCSPIVMTDPKNDSQDWPLPRILNAMLVLFQLGQVESSRSIGKNVPVIHVLRTILRVNEDSVQMYNLFLLYLEKVPLENLLTFFEDQEVYSFARLAYERLHKPDAVCQCTCGYPLGMIRHEMTFSRVGQALLAHIHKASGLLEALSMCQRTGVLWYHLLILRRSDSIEKVLPLILQTTCEEELEYRSREMSSSAWDLVFQLMARLQEGYCLQCNTKSEKNHFKAIPWMSIVSLMLLENDVDSTLEIISKYSHSIPAGSLSLDFYQNLLLVSALEPESNETKRKLLRGLSDNKKLHVMSAGLAGKLGIPHGHGEHHWGLQLQLSESHCVYCFLPLASFSGGSVLSFYCQHSFHSVCLQKQPFKQCPICTK
ncbi:uncharacterized protein LOC117647650 [Thrips palmi]|uniref:Uncharacterized protein LOC117647650 n=1 Tax=Thrips palmi TaxID=161013 RepID=A0A6P8ZQ85_THRPL|nr:uncharacterized protein LOC117647650 [Thrips palmi]